MDKKGFVALENELKAKYRNEDAVVQLNDYVFLFDKDEELRLSAFLQQRSKPVWSKGVG